MPQQRYDDELLRRLRNDIPLDGLIQHLGWPCKQRQGKFVFVCPACNETESDVNPRTNLGRCFHCGTNFNPIDFTMLTENATSVTPSRSSYHSCHDSGIVHRKTRPGPGDHRSCFYSHP